MFGRMLLRTGSPAPVRAGLGISLLSLLLLPSTAVTAQDGWRSPVLLIHGDDDRNVPFSESVDLAVELRKRDIEFEELVFPDEVHGFLLLRNWVAAFEAASDFLERKLKSGR